jgi:hypothetical protein
MGGVNIMAAAEKRVKYRRTMLWVTHDILLKLHPGQKSGDAVTWASVAPVRLHRLIYHKGINTLRIIAASEGDGGGESYCNIGIWVIWAHLRGCCNVGQTFERAGRRSENIFLEETERPQNQLWQKKG